LTARAVLEPLMLRIHFWFKLAVSVQ
jgi:hypothetical protein